MGTQCCQICDWGLLKRKQCYIYAKGTKMANFKTKKNQHKNGNDVQNNPPPYSHTISNCLTSATTRTTRGHDQKFKIPFSRIQSHQNPYFSSATQTWNSLPAELISVPTLEVFKVELAHVHVQTDIHIIFLTVNTTFLRSAFNHMPPCQRMYIAQLL